MNKKPNSYSVNGKIVEHWHNVEPVPPKEELINKGKF